jgi:hypothetical protein
MHPFRLAIAKPCQEDWNSMTGSEKRRHCSSCDKDVVLLTEMMPNDAVALVRTAKPHSLCLRIEHDDNGTVIFRKTASQASTMPLLMLTIGASMLLTACDESTSTSSAQNLDKTVSAQSVDHVEPTAADSTSTADKTSSPIAPTPVSEKTLHSGTQTASSAEGPALTGADARFAKPLNRPTTRVTTGCVCAVGDKLCDCL